MLSYHTAWNFCPRLFAPLTSTRVETPSNVTGVGLLGWLLVATLPGAQSQVKLKISANAGVTDKAAASAAAAALTRIDMNSLPLVLSSASPALLT
jgi:hypothetical protein